MIYWASQFTIEATNDDPIEIIFVDPKLKKLNRCLDKKYCMLQ